MKKLMIAFQLISITVGAQVTLENVYPNGSMTIGKRLGVVNLTSSGYKYAEFDTSSITIYDLNHVVFRTITIPPQGGIANGSFTIRYISEELFNLNPANIEYMISYSSASSGVFHIRVYDDAGNTIFTRDSFQLASFLGPGFSESSIAYTSAGVKMMLSKQASTITEVYSLPGYLPCNECTTGVISGIQPSPSGPHGNQQQLPNPYPNPTNSTTTIPYQLPPGINTGQLIVYDMLGQEVKRYTVTSSFASLEIATGELAAGTYSYSLQSSLGITLGNKFVVVE